MRLALDVSFFSFYSSFLLDSRLCSRASSKPRRRGGGDVDVATTTMIELVYQRRRSRTASARYVAGPAESHRRPVNDGPVAVLISASLSPRSLSTYALNPVKPGNTSLHKVKPGKKPMKTHQNPYETQYNPTKPMTNPLEPIKTHQNPGKPSKTQ